VKRKSVILVLGLVVAGVGIALWPENSSKQVKLYSGVSKHTRPPDFMEKFSGVDGRHFEIQCKAVRFPRPCRGAWIFVVMGSGLRRLAPG